MKRLMLTVLAVAFYLLRMSAAPGAGDLEGAAEALRMIEELESGGECQAYVLNLGTQ